MSNSHQSGCLICGADLVYSEAQRTCYYCGQSYEANAACANGHYVCDACHSLSANDLIEQYCTQTDATDAVAMAITLMNNPALNMHGPEHHFLVPAVLLASYYNQQPADSDVRAVKETKIKQARKRSDDVKGGFCGFCGACGAGVGTGIFVSLLTNATPLSKREWKLSNRMTAQSLSAIAEHGGPRCCKRDTFLALLTAADFARTELGVTLPIAQPVRCTFSAMNKQCLTTDCPFF
jgi:hypothetical protein